jgi:hypothetical protein
MSAAERTPARTDSIILPSSPMTATVATAKPVVITRAT